MKNRIFKLSPIYIRHGCLDLLNIEDIDINGTLIFFQVRPSVLKFVKFTENTTFADIHGEVNQICICILR